MTTQQNPKGKIRFSLRKYKKGKRSAATSDDSGLIDKWDHLNLMDRTKDFNLETGTKKITFS